MQVKVTLYAMLRDLLPKEARGRAVLDLPPGSTLEDVRARMNLPATVVFAVNGIVERDKNRVLQEGETVGVFRAAGGG